MGEVVFEAGQRLRIRGIDEWMVLVERDTAYGVSPVWDAGGAGCWLEEHLKMTAEVVAPAPKPRQRWKNDGDGDVQIVDADGDVAAEDWDDGVLLCRGSVVDVARWLAQRNYRCIIDPCFACVEYENAGGARGPHSCGRANLEITTHGPEATCSDAQAWVNDEVAGLGVNEYAEARHHFVTTDDLLPGITLIAATSCGVEVVGRPTPPTPSKFAQVPLATSRRLVDEAVKTLRGEPFAKAIQATLISLCGDRLEFGPRQVDIQAAINACQAWEYARGKAAPGKRSLSAAEHRELTETAKIAAWGAGISMQDASDIGEIVSETYERVRATC